jgi:hypothetical protein
MRLILLGVNTPREETRKRLDEVLSTLPRCECCWRAFLQEEDDDASSSEIKAAKTKKVRR